MLPNETNDINSNSINNIDSILNDNGNDLNMDDMEMPNDDNKSFDNDFDAGVEADEENDPKKYIQQLTGKLSQKLRDYNESLGETDEDLNKYVAGMIVKQATKGLDDDDKKEIISKINSDNESDDEPKDNSDEESNDLDNIDDNMPMECKTIKCTKKQLSKLSESFGINGDIINKDRNEHGEKIDKTKKNKVKSPFIPPSFK